MKKIIIGGLLVMSGSVLAGENKPFVMIDSSSEKDSLASEYIGANVTVGVKTANKVEYSVKAGVSLKSTTSSDTISNNLEFKVKKSFDIGMFFLPYVSVRLGEKLNYNSTHFTHYAFDAGAKIPLTNGLALDIGTRYRNAFDSAENYKSMRYHAMFLYDVDQHNTVGLRYARSYSDVSDYEERKSWRVRYQRNY
jgi:opacity protein-like surface antigen